MNTRKSHLNSSESSTSCQQQSSIAFRIQDKESDVCKRQRLFIEKIKLIINIQEREILKDNQSHKQQSIRVEVIISSSSS